MGPAPPLPPHQHQTARHVFSSIWPENRAGTMCLSTFLGFWLSMRERLPKGHLPLSEDVSEEFSGDAAGDGAPHASRAGGTVADITCAVLLTPGHCRPCADMTTTWEICCRGLHATLASKKRMFNYHLVQLLLPELRPHRKLVWRIEEIGHVGASLFPCPPCIIHCFLKLNGSVSDGLSKLVHPMRIQARRMCVASETWIFAHLATIMTFLDLPHHRYKTPAHVRQGN